MWEWFQRFADQLKTSQESATAIPKPSTVDWASAVSYNLQKLKSGVIDGRVITELVLEFQRNQGLTPDGKFGPNTASDLRQLQEMLLEQDQNKPVPPEWPVWDGPMDRQPVSRGELYAQLGTPGTAGKENKQWHRENIVKSVIPGLPRHMWVNKYVEPYFREAFRRAQISCPDYKIFHAGAHVFRHIRHDPARSLSTHSWGIAVDVNATDNRARSFKKGTVPEAWSSEWMKLWPKGLPQPFVQAFQSCGFAWGSDWDEDGDVTDHTFSDPMHFEWLGRDGNGKAV